MFFFDLELLDFSLFLVYGVEIVDIIFFVGCGFFLVFVFCFVGVINNFKEGYNFRLYSLIMYI